MKEVRVRATVAVVTWAAALFIGAALFKPLSGPAYRDPTGAARSAGDRAAMVDNDRGGRIPPVR